MKTIAATALALSVAMAGCATTGTTTTTTTDLATIVAEAEQAATVICGVSPVAESITSIVLGIVGGPGASAGLAAAEQAASLFCSAVKKPSVRHRAKLDPIGNAVDYGAITVGGRRIEVVGQPVK